MNPLVFTITVEPGVDPDDVARQLERELSEPGVVQVEARVDKPRQVDLSQLTQALEVVHVVTLVLAIMHTAPEDARAVRDVWRRLRRSTTSVAGVRDMHLDRGDRQVPINEVTEDDLRPEAES